MKKKPLDLTQFSKREQEVAEILLQGKSNKQIALALGISASTVEYHLKNIYRKLQVSSRTEAVLRLGKSTGSNPGGELGKSTVEINDEPADNRGKFISTGRIPMIKSLYPIGGIILMTAFVVVLLLVNMPAQSGEIAPTAQASLTAGTPLSAETPSPHPTNSTLTQEPIFITMTANAVPSILDVVHFVGENHADGTNVAPGEIFTKTWKVQNTGTTTWTTGYSYVMTDASYPLGESQGHPPQINIPCEVKPGETVEISADITAPQTDSIYEVHYKLKNSDGQYVSGDGYEIWFKIAVGNVSIVAPAEKPSNVTLQLINIQKDATTTTADICAQWPDTRDWSPGNVLLSAGNTEASPISYGLKNPKDPNTYTSSYRCFFLEFPVGLNNFADDPVLITIGKIHILISDATNCPYIKPQLLTLYPGLDFTCGSIGFFYTNLRVPSGMTESQADTIIMDAMESAIYGPWVLSE